MGTDYGLSLLGNHNAKLDSCCLCRAVYWFEAREVDIKPLLENLELAKNKRHWGSQFRFGPFEISEQDMQLIYAAICAE